MKIENCSRLANLRWRKNSSAYTAKSLHYFLGQTLLAKTLRHTLQIWLKTMATHCNYQYILPHRGLAYVHKRRHQFVRHQIELSDYRQIISPYLVSARLPLAGRAVLSLFYSGRSRYCYWGASEWESDRTSFPTIPFLQPCMDFVDIRLIRTMYVVEGTIVVKSSLFTFPNWCNPF